MNEETKKTLEELKKVWILKGQLQAIEQLRIRFNASYLISDTISKQSVDIILEGYKNSLEELNKILNKQNGKH
jgi:hypothetical protein